MTVNADGSGLATKSAVRGEKTGAVGARRLVIFGAGYVGGALARRALAAGWRVTALTRNPETAEALRALGCAVVVGELSGEEWWNAPELAGGAERVAVTVAGGGRGTEGYRVSYVAGLRSVVGWGACVRAAGGVVGHLIYTSSTSVYPQDGGVVVTESDATGGEGELTRALLEAERIVGDWTGSGATVLRLAGIYGPGRTHLLEQVRSGEVAGHAGAHLNLVYRDDIVDALEVVWARGVRSGEQGVGRTGGAAEDYRTTEHGLQNCQAAGDYGLRGGKPAGGNKTIDHGPQDHGETADRVMGRGVEVFNIADEGRATKGEVAGWLAARLGVVEPRFTGLPAGGRRAVTPDRIIDAGRAREVLGWRAAHPTFREGYVQVLAERRELCR